MPTPLDPRKKPTDVKIRVSTGEGLDVVWADGHASHYDFVYLREHCPCATCGDERRKKHEAPIQDIPQIKNALPIFKPKPRARAAKMVGNYALQMEFTDGHGTGIYSYDYLRTICPCKECAETFRGGS